MCVCECERLGPASFHSSLSFTHQKVDSAAHAVVAALIVHHRTVVKETNEESFHQGDKVLHL